MDDRTHSVRWPTSLVPRFSPWRAPESGIGLNNRPFCDRCATSKMPGGGHRLADVAGAAPGRRSLSAWIDDAIFVRYRMLHARAPSWHWPKSSAAATDLEPPLRPFRVIPTRWSNAFGPKPVRLSPIHTWRRMRLGAEPSPATSWPASLKRWTRMILSPGRRVAGLRRRPGVSWTEFGELLTLYHGWSRSSWLAVIRPRVGSDPPRTHQCSDADHRGGETREWHGMLQRLGRCVRS
jgi:hypothetical protein